MKVIDIKAVSLKKTIEVYKSSSDELKLQSLIWEKTRDIEKATKVYKNLKKSTNNVDKKCN